MFYLHIFALSHDEQCYREAKEAKECYSIF